MAWTLVEADEEGLDGHQFKLQTQGLYYLTYRAGEQHLALSDVDESPIGLQKLGCITVGPWGVKLKALDAEFGISSAHTGPTEPSYLLNTSTSESSEIILLRKDDKVCVPRVNKRLILKHNSAEVQVNSSVAADAEVPESEKHQVDSELLRHLEQDEASDTQDEDLDQPQMAVAATHSKKAEVSRTTPTASVPRTQVVQETPAVDRVLAEVVVSSKKDDEGSTTGETPSAEDTAIRSTELFSAALSEPSKITENETIEGPDMTTETSQIAPKDVTPTGDEESNELSAASPKPQKARSKKVTVQIQKRSSRKRGSQELDAPSNGSAMTPTRPPKRPRRSNAASQAEDTTEVETSTRKSAMSTRKGRLSNVQPSPSPQPSNDTRQSFDPEDQWVGPKPVVAFSNSAMPEQAAIMKFFKNQGGTKVESIKEGECNILCVRDAPLRKSTKLLMALVLGIQIVTDKWLSDSAKQKGFLVQHKYMPSNPEQERDWKFSLERIWAQKQPDLFKGFTIYFTPALKQHYDSFREIENLCKLAGARRTMSKLGREFMVADEQTILLGLEEKDPDCKVLVEKGFKCFSKDFLTMSIMRAQADIDSDEFRIKIDTVTATESKRKGRPRKS
ncbi:hypothetical protein K491DRAFT_659771 [Lophiostoma macrostomum CBS 122681]|uniref:BRCT domain-containing protein n=1 Tax=Lophiostoma macrostomum CBS 122681 TaxID=1314788 RepID=A0A6A6T3G2_9PLEO|nr:hypothetical protein K491DRAFT_659771 [Lophiostoma macrostomum CBS 122681]